MTAPTPTTFEALQKKQTELIRKPLAGAVMLAPVTAALPATLTTGTDSSLATLPTGYNDLGLITKADGLSWSRAVDSAETTSWGFSDPTRRDITSDVSSLQLTAQETNVHTLGLYNNLDLTTVVPDVSTGEVSFAQPLRAATRFYRLFAISVDGVGADAIYIGRLLPRAMVSDIGDQAWTDADEMAYQVTITATPDLTAGYSIRHFFGGPGWKALTADMGFGA